MSFLSGIDKLVGLDNYALDEKITILGKKGIIVEGHKGIYSFSENKVEVKMKKNLLEINGNHFKILEINLDELILEGKVDSVNTVEY